MRVYEELFIIKPDIPEEEADAYIKQVQAVITSGKGTVDKTDKWGTRKLAYRVSKYSEGVYVLIQFTAEPALVHEVERRMRVSDQVIKFITVRIDEKQKKIDKRKKAREKRAARKPAPAPAPAAAVPHMPAEPAAVAPGVPEVKAPEIKAAETKAPAEPKSEAKPEVKE